MDPTKEHSHYFPISQEVEGTTTGYYTHRHKENNPHSKKTVPSFTFNFFTDRYARFQQILEINFTDNLGNFIIVI